MMNDWPVPEIRAQCSKCYKWRDLRFEMHCGFCGSASIMAATTQRIRTNESYPGRLCESGPPLSTWDKLGVTELDNLYTLEDTRDAKA